MTEPLVDPTSDATTEPGIGWYAEALPAPPRPPRSIPWGRLAAVVLAIAAVVVAVLAVANQEERAPGLALIAVAWVLALWPMMFLLRRTTSSAVKIPAVVGLAALLTAASFPVVLRSCFERLGPAANLEGCNFAQVDLAGLDLAGARLAGADLTEADLSRADLGGADLTGATMAGTDLTEANLTEATLKDAVLDRARLDGVTLADADLTGVQMSQASMENADLRRATLTGATLDGVSLRLVTLESADLTGSQISATMVEVDMRNATLDGATLANTDLSEAELQGASLRDATLESTTIARAHLRGAILDGATLRDVDGSRASLQDVSFTGATLDDVSLDGANLTGYTGLPDDMLATGLGTTPGGLGGFLTARTIRLEPRADVIAGLGGACRGRAISEAASASAAFQGLLVLDARGNSFKWTNDGVRAGWEPMAVRFGGLVACVDESTDTVERCSYTQIETGIPGSITRYRHDTSVRVVRARNAATVAERTFQGSNPDQCPFVTQFASNGRIDGSHVSFGKIRSMLAGLRR